MTEQAASVSGKLGDLALRGVGQPQELFIIDRGAAAIVPLRPLG